MGRFRQQNELLALTATPAGRDGDAIFVVNKVPKFAGIEGFGRRRRWHRRVVDRSILTHFPPLLTTFRAKRQHKLMPLSSRSVQPYTFTPHSPVAPIDTP